MPTKAEILSVVGVFTNHKLTGKKPIYNFQPFVVLLSIYISIMPNDICAQNQSISNIDSIIKQELFLNQNKKMVHSRALTKKLYKGDGIIVSLIIDSCKKAGHHIDLNTFTEPRPFKERVDFNYIEYLTVIKLDFKNDALAEKWTKNLVYGIEHGTGSDQFFMRYKSGFILVSQNSCIWFILVNDCGSDDNKKAYDKLKPKANKIYRALCGVS